MSTFVTPAIPVSQTVQVNFNVLSAGGGATELCGLMLDYGNAGSYRTPIGAIQEFVDAADVAAWFGASSIQAQEANVYFTGPNAATVQPAFMLIAQYPYAAVPGWMQGGGLGGMTLTQLQAINGNLTLNIDGTPATQAVNLSAATSFSNAAEIIATDFSIKGPELGTLTASLATTVMTVTVALGFALPIGAVVTGTGIGSNVYVASYGTCSGAVGSTGTVNLSTSVTTESAETITAYAPAVIFDSVSGAFQFFSGTTGALSSVAYGSGAVATSLLLTQALGAIVSPGAAAAGDTGAAAFMNAIIAQTQNFLSLWPDWEPTDTLKEGFATWNNTAGGGKQFRNVMWDTSVTNTGSGGPTAPVYLINGNSDTPIPSAGLNGTVMVHVNPAVDPLGLLAAFVASWPACLDFTKFNGAQTADFKAQNGLPAQVFNGTIANYLGGSPISGGFGYGMNYYGNNTLPNAPFTYYARGQISGAFVWDDDYCFQVWLKNQFQLAWMTLLTSVGRIPYNAAGDALIYGSIVGAPFGTDGAGPVNNAVGFGMIEPGINLSSEQLAVVNNAAGLDIGPSLYNNGWYLQVLPASAATRAARTSPPINFWYTTGESIQAILASATEVQ